METTATLIDPNQLTVAAKDAAALLGISRAQFFKLHSQGKVPRPVRLGTRAPRWRVAELRDWVCAGCPNRGIWERTMKA